MSNVALPLAGSRPATPPAPITATGTPPTATHSLPPPQVLAANPDLIPNVREYGTKTEAWTRMMRAADDNNGAGAPALASATIARAMASYGTAGGTMPLADTAHAAKR
jgi:hypothetical protein